MNKPLISIVVPVYNVEKFIDECITSIINQSFREFELLLINDGSLDKSGEICDKYSLIDSRVRVIHKKNSGVSDSRNIGIDLAKGRYLMFADSDDYVDKDWCKKLYNMQEKYKDSMIVCSYIMRNSSKLNTYDVEKKYTSIEEYLKFDRKNFMEIYNCNLLNSLCNKIYDLNIIKKNNIKLIKDLSLGEDLLFNLEYIKRVNDIIYLNDSLYVYYRRGIESLDNKYYKNLFEIYKKINSELYKVILELDVNFDMYKKDFYNDYFYMLRKVLNNTFSKNNNISFIDKLKYNSYILNSYDMDVCLKNIGNEEISKRYLKLFKKKRYINIYVYEKIGKVRKKLKNKKKLEYNGEENIYENTYNAYK